MVLKLELQKNIPDILKDRTFRGRRPTTESAIDTRVVALEAERRARIIKCWQQLAQLFLLGVILPTSALFFATLHYNWFYAGVPPLVDLATAQPVPRPGLIQLSLFTVDQLLKGGLSDLMEVIRLQVSPVSNNTAAYPFSVLLFGFRSYLDIFVILGFASLADIIVKTHRLRRSAPMAVQIAKAQTA